MLRSLSSAVTGMQSQQTEMDIIGNNIANVNTPGFRSSRANFEDLFYQTLQGGSETSNPSEVGYGAEVGSIDKNMGRVGATETDRALDVYIDGDGYFSVNTKADGTGDTLYTRVGDFHIDSQGDLVDSNGNFVEGAAKASNGDTVTSGPINLESQNSLITLQTDDGTIIPIDSNSYQNLSISIGSDGSIQGEYNGQSGTLCSAQIAPQGTDTSFDYSKLSNIAYDATTKTYTGTYDGTANTTLTVGASQELHIGVFNFVNEDGLSESGNSYYTADRSSGQGVCTIAGDNNTTGLRTGELEMSNVDLASEFTNMIVSERGYQANARVITTSDTLLQELVNLVHE